MHYRITKTVSLQLDSLRPILIRTKLGRRQPSSHISERSKFYPRTMKLALSFCVTLFFIYKYIVSVSKPIPSPV